MITLWDSNVWLVKVPLNSPESATYIYIFRCKFLLTCSCWILTSHIVSLLFCIAINYSVIKYTCFFIHFFFLFAFNIFNLPKLLKTHLFYNKLMFVIHRQKISAHTRFSCTAPTGNRVMALCYCQIYILDRWTFCPYVYLGNGSSDFIIPCRRFRGGYRFGVVSPSFLFCPSVRPAMDYGKLTKGVL